jgi:hypothetical protein
MRFFGRENTTAGTAVQNLIRLTETNEMRAETIYIADDGTRFSSRQECLEYERITELSNLLKPYVSNDDPWVLAKKVLEWVSDSAYLDN